MVSSIRLFGIYYLSFVIVSKQRFTPVNKASDETSDCFDLARVGRILQTQHFGEIKNPVR